MAWTRLASRSRLRRPAAVAPRASLPSPSPSPPPAPRAGPLAPSSSPSPRRHLLLPRFRFTAAAFSPSPSPSPVRLLGDRCWAGDARRWFASETSAVPASAGEAAELVEVPLAQTGEGIAECELLRWYVTEGDQVDEFQPLCEVQSDKATIEITSRFQGKVHQIHFGPGDIVKVGETLLKMIVGDSQSVSHDNIAPPIDKSLGVDSTNPSGEDNIPSGALSTPAVRHLAKQYGLNINDIQGTGKDGRVLKEDVLNHAVSKGLRKELSSVLEENIGQVELLEEGKSLLDVHCYEDKKIPLRGYQRSMVKSMSLAAKVPHFHYLEEINCDALVELKAAFQNENKDHNIKHTFLPFLIKSLSMALSKYPLLNSSFIEETNEVVLKGSHNIGVAMATEHGLVVPNIKTVQSLSILEITKELARLHETALHNRLSSTDISGGTITLSNIGAIGGKFGSPLLNLPEVAIIALGRIQKLPRFDDDENVYASSIMNVTVGADHRVVDGAMVARFCNEWKILVEKPKLLLLHMR
ncbi:lipoamide acyltransferase component of branched-chain alpha-keto acid dehydrogenase complex, mitochondrial-like isoform X1 [Phragmites australis]|uniref:lipoamide acyltransferase component of branched-chain alpha-keto acid dehydrogenase complex, mitochondrial-like isoform X1 n=1 Tax=Phragmites australis TaxID=29695 RepID=UPI002D7A0748|nr:lipoamide acyltransferase component of branched-chain alpha-keto acid dehydrogenase complex, mitochondrial-like isoform X1 [Phragmites australis]